MARTDPDDGSEREQPPADIDPDLAADEPDRRWPEPGLPALVAAVAVGGVVGAEARYGLGLALPHSPSQWPWATLLINTSGCFLIGVLTVVITELVDAHPLTRPLLGVGFLGGYTTFSTYTVDVITLANNGRWAPAIGYLVATPVLAVLAATGGVAATRATATGTTHPHPARSGPDAAEGTVEEGGQP
ncbi:fluoride efflux transporter CrcB [Pseudonocardia kujensis]|uniref:fluoride efflux transporter CrcB n=1 Tax=Pseudonocardia kujensis TaxID=1128675 RepID=UPI001E3F13C2|nr:fluoride efflux transporter CrcB [Pseudonocardia kujensis]MCE0764389.1 fluoride efflux transporter CrcB [Pseudonocardia kujensis]